MLTNIDQRTTASPNAASNLRPSARLALAGLSLSMLMPSLDTSIANAGLPTIAQAFGATFQEIQWIVLSYLLAVTTLIVSVGRLGDIVGRRRLLVVGIGIFTAASLVCGAAPAFWMLIAARSAQGLGAAIMINLSVALVGETVPKEKTGSTMGLLGTMSAIGTTLGPSLGGLLIAAAGWQSIFLINIPVGILGLYLVRRFVPADAPKAGRGARTRFDSLGTAVLGTCLAAYALAMTVGSGSFGPLNTALLTASFAGIGLFIIVASKVAAPLIRLSLFRDPVRSAGLAMSALVSTVLMSTLVVGPFYLSHGLGLNTAVVGVTLSVGPLAAALSGVPAGVLVDRIGTKHAAVIGLAGIAIGSLTLSLMPSAYGIAGYLCPVVVVTSSYALFQAANNTAVISAAGSDQKGVLSGMLSLSRNLGLITGAAVMGAVYAAASGSTGLTAGSPATAEAGMHRTFAAAFVLISAALAIAAVSRILARRTIEDSDILTAAESVN